MAKYNVKVSCPVPSSFEVDSVRGMFDLKKKKMSEAAFDVELPDDDETIGGEPWRIGVIVGPSGSGKTTVARHAYGDRFLTDFEWGRSQAVVSQFDGLPMKQVTHALSAVGFSSPPAWVRPHHVLSIRWPMPSSRNKASATQRTGPCIVANCLAPSRWWL